MTTEMSPTERNSMNRTYGRLLCFLLVLALDIQAASSLLTGANKRVSIDLKASRLFSGVNPAVVAEGSNSPCRIKVIGVGGGGGNAVNRMVESDTTVDGGVEMWVVNTDAQALSRSLASKKLNIGVSVSRGLGAGGNPLIGARAAEESREEIITMVKDTDLVFVTAGMGGGTGSGAAPIIAECAKRSGALTVGVVTKPFGFEGRKRMDQARDAINEMKSRVDTLIVVSNDRLLQIVPPNTPVQDAFLVADDILRQGVVGISEIIVKPGLINVDFADVRTIMQDAGTALMGIGQGKGKTRAQDAALAAISSPLLDFPIAKAKGIVFNVIGGSDLTLQEINAAAEVIYKNVDSDANIIFGALIDEKILDGEVSITVLATGFSTDYFDAASEDGKANLRAVFAEKDASKPKIINTKSSAYSQTAPAVNTGKLAPRKVANSIDRLNTYASNSGGTKSMDIENDGASYSKRDGTSSRPRYSDLDDEEDGDDFFGDDDRSYGKKQGRKGSVEKEKPKKRNIVRRFFGFIFRKVFGDD